MIIFSLLHFSRFKILNKNILCSFCINSKNNIKDINTGLNNHLSISVNYYKYSDIVKFYQLTLKHLLIMKMEMLANASNYLHIIKNEKN